MKKLILLLLFLSFAYPTFAITQYKVSDNTYYSIEDYAHSLTPLINDFSKIHNKLSGNDKLMVCIFRDSLVICRETLVSLTYILHMNRADSLNISDFCKNKILVIDSYIKYMSTAIVTNNQPEFNLTKKVLANTKRALEKVLSEIDPTYIIQENR